MTASPQPPFQLHPGPFTSPDAESDKQHEMQHHQEVVPTQAPSPQPQSAASPRARLLQVSQEPQQAAPKVSTQRDVLQVSGDSGTSIPMECSED